jgi:hypothetical protein
MADRRCSRCGEGGHTKARCTATPPAWVQALEASGGAPGGGKGVLEPGPAAAPLEVPAVATRDAPPSSGERGWPATVPECIEAMEAVLVEQGSGIEPLTPFWRETIRGFYASGKKQLVGRVGRRGRKSYTWCGFVAIAEILTARHAVPPGDTGVVSIISANKDQAADRIATCIAMLDALGVAYKKTAKGIEFTDRPYRISILAASISAVSSYTCILAIGDEVTKWTDGDSKVNPARAVISSWRATLLTQPLAKMVLLSSPMGFEDEHAQAFDRGETRAQSVCYAPTWVANPSVTEEMCRVESEAERDPETWFLRECKAIPQSADDQDAGITLAKVDRAKAIARERETGLDYQAGLYACPRMNEWALMVVTRRRGADDEIRTAVVHTAQWPAQVDIRAMLGDVKKRLDGYGLDWARTPTAGFALATRRFARPLGLAIVDDAMTDEMHESLRVRFASDGMEIPDVAELRADILAQRKRVSLSSTAFEARRFAVLLALLASRVLQDPPPVKIVVCKDLAWWQAQEAARLAADMKREEAEGYRLVRERNESREAGDWVQDMAKELGYA